MEDKYLIVIENLKEWEQNPRNIKKDDLERLKSQLELLGQHSPLLVTSDGTVLGGNMRLKALRELGVKRVWVTPINFSQDEQGLWSAQINGVSSPKKFQTKEDGMMEFSLSHNDRAGFYDEDLLANIEGNYNIDWDQYSVDLSEPITLADLFIDDFQAKEDEPPEVDEVNPPKSEVGMVYQLGKHRLMCGDSTKLEDVEKLMDGQKADMVFTDPPYGVDYQSRVDEERRKGWGEIKNDGLKGKELQDFLRDCLAFFDCPKYVCCNWQSVIDFWQAFGKPNSWIVWDKGSIGLGAGFRNQHEFILFYGSLDHNSESNVWNLNRDNTSDYTHPTQKPVGIPARAIKNSSEDNQIVVDVFGGSGSTLIACEQLNRTCLMMELDPKYADVIRKRYAQLIGDGDNWEVITPALLIP